MDIQTKSLYLTLITGLAFITGLLVLYIYSLRKQYLQRIGLSRQQLTREVELIDRERERIAHDLHDELGSGLAAIGLLLQQVKEKKDTRVLDKACDALQEQRKRIRQIAHNFVPRILASHGLQYALTDLLDELGSPAGPVLEAELTLEDEDFSAAKSVHVFRIIREILLNTLQHANATRIRFSCSQDAGFLNLYILDNGTGWMPDPGKRKAGGWGLQSIDTRAKLLQAQIEYRLVKNQETVCRIRIPLSSMR